MRRGDEASGCPATTYGSTSPHARERLTPPSEIPCALRTPARRILTLCESYRPKSYSQRDATASAAPATEAA